MVGVVSSRMQFTSLENSIMDENALDDSIYVYQLLMRTPIVFIIPV